MNKYLTPVKGDHFRVIINSTVNPKKDKITTEISFEYYPENNGNMTLKEVLVFMSNAIVARTEEDNKDIARIVKFSDLVEATGRNPSKFIINALTELANKAIELRERFIEGKTFEEISYKKIVVDTIELKERGLLNE